MAGLAPEPELIIEVDEGEDRPDIDDSGAILKIEHPDGAITISLDGRPVIGAPVDDSPTGWFDNLVDRIDNPELTRIAEDLLRSISDDKESRKEWESYIETGIKLLGFKLEVPGLQGASDGAPIEGMSKVRHPLLAEAVLQFQANARSELLPTDGPVKIRDDANGNPPQMGHNGGPPLEGSTVGDTLESDELADALEKDLNHYLTTTASEYYPDTDRMLMKLGLGGMSFKKVYFCPLRERPVSETVDSDDLIVNSSATDLKNARRITHRISLRPSIVKRLQILGVYRDIPLSDPSQADLDSVQRAERDQSGVSQSAGNPLDRDREIYECYCELDVKGFEHKRKGKVTGLEIPYRVTIDVTSHEILSIVRNYEEETKELPEAKTVFVKYTFVPGFDFCDIGLLHILGNSTNAVTAAWREMLDNGMYANFPGFLIGKSATRQNTNLIRVAPGAGAQVDISGMDDIRKAIMQLPYNTAQMGPLMQLVENIVETGQRVAGSAQTLVGEGKQDIPVGTMLAMIEQATKMVGSVHKRMHTSQAEEFRLLVAVFRDHPESFLRYKKHPSGQKWTEKVFIQALSDYNLTPQADPNTASHTQRIMKVLALLQLAKDSPALYDPRKINEVAIKTIGYSNPDEFLVANPQPPPQVQEAMAKAGNDAKIANAKETDSKARMIDAQTKAQDVKNKGLVGAQQGPTPVDVYEAQTSRMDAETKADALKLQAHRSNVDDENRDLDRQAKEKETVLDFASEIMRNPQQAEAGAHEVKPIEREIGADDQ